MISSRLIYHHTRVPHQSQNYLPGKYISQRKGRIIALWKTRVGADNVNVFTRRILSSQHTRVLEGKGRWKARTFFMYYLIQYTLSFVVHFKNVPASSHASVTSLCLCFSVPGVNRMSVSLSGLFTSYPGVKGMAFWVTDWSREHHLAQHLHYSADLPHSPE